MSFAKMLGREKPDTISESVQTHPANYEGELGKAASLSNSDEDREVQAIDPMVEKRLLRKMDRNIIPLVMALCMNLLCRLPLWSCY